MPIECYEFILARFKDKNWIRTEMSAQRRFMEQNEGGSNEETDPKSMI